MVGTVVARIATPTANESVGSAAGSRMFTNVVMAATVLRPWRSSTVTGCTPAPLMRNAPAVCTLDSVGMTSVSCPVLVSVPCTSIADGSSETVNESVRFTGALSLASQNATRSVSA